MFGRNAALLFEPRAMKHCRWISSFSSLTMFLGLFAASAFGQTWSAPKTLVSVSGAQLVYGASVGVNATGEVVAAATVNNQVQVQVRTGGGWSSPTVLTTASQSIALSQVAVAPNGDGVVMWLMGEKTNSYILQGSFYTAGAWSPAVTISSAGMVVNHVAIVYDAAGLANLVWVEANSTRTSCATKAATVTSTGFRAGRKISSLCASYVRLAANAKGEVLALLSYGNGWVISRSAKGVWGAPIQVLQMGYRPGLQAIALSDTGVAVAITEFAGDMYFSKRALNGTWSQQAYLAAGAGATGQLAIAIDAKGNAEAAFTYWTTNSGGGVVYPMEASRLAAASYTWSRPVRITGSSVVVGTYSMAATRAGTFLVGWTDGGYSINPKGNVAISSMAAGTTTWKIGYLGWGYPDISVAVAPGTAVALFDQYWSNPGALLFSSATVK